MFDKPFIHVILRTEDWQQKRKREAELNSSIQYVNVPQNIGIRRYFSSVFTQIKSKS